MFVFLVRFVINFNNAHLIEKWFRNHEKNEMCFITVETEEQFL